MHLCVCCKSGASIARRRGEPYHEDCGCAAHDGGWTRNSGSLLRLRTVANAITHLHSCRASELLVGLNPEAAVFDNNDPLLFPHRPPPAFDADGGAHDDLYLLAKSYFDSREYARSAGVLASLVEKGGKDFVIAANPPCPPREFFLRIYSLYLVRRPGTLH